MFFVFFIIIAAALQAGRAVFRRRHDLDWAQRPGLHRRRGGRRSDGRLHDRHRARGETAAVHQQHDSSARDLLQLAARAGAVSVGRSDAEELIMLPILAAIC